ncbi:MAG TPA: hypothetical protein VE710_05710 [Candidatus Bathyarchaeia archaeon]|nr:hypothetical protein [Candidatus Bathyarchaeia archaeon]
METELLLRIQGEFGQIFVKKAAAQDTDAELNDLYAFLLEAYLLDEELKKAEKPADS